MKQSRVCGALKFSPEISREQDAGSPEGRIGYVEWAEQDLQDVDMASPEQIELHRVNRCVPCGYYKFRADGCRMGWDCAFCHLCDVSEEQALVRRKRYQKVLKPKKKD
mmetsp:Transcript_97788/g.174222  ORF Transcript_97788/g.174222 Transcript_97788/m.174222 type:complete len:108 (+) Transcript_97788:2-325(+)